MSTKSEFSFYHYINITLTLLVLFNALIWIISDHFYLTKANQVISQESHIAQERADDLGDSIRRNLNYLHGVPDLFSQLLRVKWAVKKFGPSTTPSPLSQVERANKWTHDATLLNLNRYLDFSAQSLHVDLIYVSNAAGDAIAASNWNTPTNTVGINIAEREYFKKNKQGQNGIQYAVGKTTKVPGLFFATPIILDGVFYGSAVAKADVHNLSFLIKQMNAFVVDDNGIVILARDKAFEMNSLPNAAISQLSLQDKAALYLRDYFPVLQVEAWGDKSLPSLVKIQNSTIPHLLTFKRLSEYNLTVYIDSPLDTLSSLKQDYFWFTLLLSALVSVLIIITTSSVTYFKSIKNSKEMLWKQANFDTLTGLPNRDLLRDRLLQEIRKADRSGIPLAVLLIDLDQFKEINDTLGHQFGDLLLSEAAQRLSDCIRKSDTVARLSGDEFIVILPHLSKNFHVDDIAQKIITSLAAPFHLRNELAHISASIGITLYPNDAKNLEDLLKNADQAMYVSKNNGRNRFSYFTQSLQVEAQKRLRLTKDLRVALADNQFKVYFQPIINLSTGKVHKAEALLRWIHPERGMISPVDFIPLAEETRLILDMGAWVRIESAAWCKRWNEMCNEPFQISINMSPVEFMDESGKASVANFIAHLKVNNMSGENFVFEITEGMLLNISDSVSAKLVELRDAGIQVSLDDFGTGYSSLSYLKKLDIDYLKIDKSFVCNLATDSDDLVLCEAIISMAHKLGLQVIAEGVETFQQHDLLVRANCDFAQGYFYSRPIPPDELEIWIKNKNLTNSIH